MGTDHEKTIQKLTFFSMKNIGVTSKLLLDNRECVQQMNPSISIPYVPYNNISCRPNPVPTSATYVMQHQFSNYSINIGNILYWNDIGYIIPDCNIQLFKQNNYFAQKQDYVSQWT